MKASEICNKLPAMGDRQRALATQRFFKTGLGEYGEGDIFVGLTVPEVRKLAKEYRSLPLIETKQLLQSPIHEARLLALFILISAYKQGDPVRQEQIYHLYLENTRFINNWDLVDASAHHIVGAYLKDRRKAPLHALAASQLLWERRIAIIATFHYIQQGEFAQTLQIAKLLLRDQEDLIHKAVGWMLRETGKRNQQVEEKFLQKHYKTMPRTMLRYAIERFPEKLRQQYLRGEIA
ncbi:MAG: DNA alkylation repair protein [Deltaproteobacteria bacterium HGW-Deltaproteobacteria-12]|nr:MAG: DNA alkylation repair protein [Deltaproteobacteria bacterium HGW-Deltaproteobacteria-12]